MCMLANPTFAQGLDFAMRYVLKKKKRRKQENKTVFMKVSIRIIY